MLLHRLQYRCCMQLETFLLSPSAQCPAPSCSWMMPLVVSKVPKNVTEAEARCFPSIPGRPLTQAASSAAPGRERGKEWARGPFSWLEWGPEGLGSRTGLARASEARLGLLLAAHTRPRRPNIFFISSLYFQHSVDVSVAFNQKSWVYKLPAENSKCSKTP